MASQLLDEIDQKLPCFWEAPAGKSSLTLEKVVGGVGQLKLLKDIYHLLEDIYQGKRGG